MITSENHLVRFPSFSVYCLLMFCFVCCIICDLNHVNGACYCIASLAARHVPQVCFWPAKNGRNLISLRCIHVLDLLLLKFCSDINEEISIQVLFHFTVLVNIVASFIGTSYFHLWVGFWVEVFSYCTFNGNVCNWLPKLIWPRMHCFWSFLTGICLVSSFPYRQGLKSARIAQVFFFFLRHQIFSIVSLMGILVCSLNVPVLFSHRIL